MKYVRARLLPDPTTQTLLVDTLAEFRRVCLWVQAHAPAQARDMHEIRRQMYDRVRQQTVLGTMLLNGVFGVVAAYRKASSDMGCVQGAMNPQKLVYYSNSLSIKGRQVSILLAKGRVDCPFDLPKPTDYDTLKSTTLKRGDLSKGEDGSWYLDLSLFSQDIEYVDDVA